MRYWSSGVKQELCSAAYFSCEPNVPLNRCFFIQDSLTFIHLDLTGLTPLRSPEGSLNVHRKQEHPEKTHKENLGFEPRTSLSKVFRPHVFESVCLDVTVLPTMSSIPLMSSTPHSHFISPLNQISAALVTSYPNLLVTRSPLRHGPLWSPLPTCHGSLPLEARATVLEVGSGPNMKRGH